MRVGAAGWLLRRGCKLQRARACLQRETARVARIRSPHPLTRRTRAATTHITNHPCCKLMVCMSGCMSVIGEAVHACAQQQLFGQPLPRHRPNRQKMRSSLVAAPDACSTSGRGSTSCLALRVQRCRPLATACRWRSSLVGRAAAEPLGRMADPEYMQARRIGCCWAKRSRKSTDASALTAGLRRLHAGRAVAASWCLLDEPCPHTRARYPDGPIVSRSTQPSRRSCKTTPARAAPCSPPICSLRWMDRYTQTAVVRDACASALCTRRARQREWSLPEPGLAPTQAALCTLLGTAASYAYLNLLFRDVDSYTGETVVPMMEAEKASCQACAMQLVCLREPAYGGSVASCPFTTLTTLTWPWPFADRECALAAACEGRLCVWPGVPASPASPGGTSGPGLGV